MNNDNKEIIYRRILLICMIISLSIIALLMLKKYNIYCYIIMIILIIIDAIILFRISHREKKKISYKEDLEHFSEYFISDSLFNQIYPFAIIKEDGEIIWCNKRFKATFSIDNANGINIASAVRGLSLEKVFETNRNYVQKININKNVYEVYSKKVVDAYKNGNIIMVFFNDVTYVEEGTKESIMIIEVDNMSDIKNSIDSVKASILVGEIESVITEYAKGLNAMIKKYEDNKYILSVLDSNIESEISSKFAIKDKVKKVSIGNKLEPTLSIGIGRGGDTPRENQKYAVMALDLALGRGGDQVVVKRREDLSFFGGTTKEIESRTRVRARVISHSLKDLVYESSNVYIIGHKNPDMDCFGAAIGLSAVIRQLGKTCRIVIGDDTKAVDIYLNKIKEEYKDKDIFINYEDVINKIDDNSLVIVVDVHARNYVSCIEAVDKAKKVVVIDHHRRSADIIKGALITYIEVYASSTSELITEMVQYMLDNPKLKQIEAEGLLAGICVDTKNFYFKTGVRTFEAASFLRKLGADTVDVKQMFSDDLSSYIQRCETIKSAKVEDGIAIAICPPDVTDTVIAAQAADELLNIVSIKVSFALVKIKDAVAISGRSFGDVNVQVILEELGGGGHMNIAGAKINNVTMDEAVEMLKNSINKHLKKGD